MKVKSESEVAQSCPTLSDPMDCSSKVMLKIVQARLQQYMSRELPDVQSSFRKGRGARNQNANICWIIEKARVCQKKSIYFCFIDYAKDFDCVDHNKLWKILKEMSVSNEKLSNLEGIRLFKAKASKKIWKI